MKKILLTILIILSLFPLVGAKIGISLGTFDALSNKFLDEGTDIQSGLIIGLAPYWEAEAFITTKVTPKAFDQIFGAIGTSFSLMGPVYEKKSSVPTYATAYAGVGFFANLIDFSSYGPYIRLTPLSVGGPQFRLRERTLSLSLYYDIPNNSIAFMWNLFLLDFFLN